MLAVRGLLFPYVLPAGLVRYYIGGGKMPSGALGCRAEGLEPSTP